MANQRNSASSARVAGAIASAAPARNVAAARFSRPRRATWPASSSAVVKNTGNSQRHGGASSSRSIQTVSTVATTVSQVAAERMACSGVMRRASMIQWSSSASSRRWMIFERVAFLARNDALAFPRLAPGWIVR